MSMRSEQVVDLKGREKRKFRSSQRMERGPAVQMHFFDLMESGPMVVTTHTAINKIHVIILDKRTNF